MTIVPIQPGDIARDPMLQPYSGMRDAELAQRSDPLDAKAHGGLFIAEGDLVVRRLLASRFVCQSVLLAANRLDGLVHDLSRLPPKTPVFVAEPAVLSDLVGFNMHRGVLAVGVRGPGLSLAELLSRPGPILVLEDLVNHDNLGGIFRNAAALGGPGVGVVLSPRCADPLYRKSLRVSMGAILSVPFARATDWPGDLAQLAAGGCEPWAMVAQADAEPLARAASERRGQGIALVLGSEGPGLAPATVAACARRVTIRMDKADTMIDSLNVGMAAGIALYELARSRTDVPGGIASGE